LVSLTVDKTFGDEHDTGVATDTILIEATKGVADAVDTIDVLEKSVDKVYTDLVNMLDTVVIEFTKGYQDSVGTSDLMFTEGTKVNIDTAYVMDTMLDYREKTEEFDDSVGTSDSFELSVDKTLGDVATLSDVMIITPIHVVNQHLNGTVYNSATFG
jgi:hypothetical protein